MTAIVLKQDPNTKRFKRTLIYYDTVFIILWLDEGDFPQNLHVVCP